MTSIKNVSPYILASVILGALSIIVLLPIDTLLMKMSLSNFKSEYIGLTIKMAIVFTISYSIIKKMNIESIIGFSSKYEWKFKYLNLIPTYLIVIGVLSILSKDLGKIQIENLLLLLLACLTVGFAEEFLFRGLLQSIFLKKYLAHKNGLFISTLIPAIIFGLFHLINLTKNSNVSAVLIQVVFATLIGFFFGVLVLKTNKILPVAVTHGLINFFFSIAFLPNLKFIEETGTSFLPIILTLPLFIIGLLVLKKTKKEDLVIRLNDSFT